MNATQEQRSWLTLDARISGALRFAITILVVDLILVRFFDGSHATFFVSFSVVAVLWFMDFEGTALDRLRGYAIGTVAGVIGTIAGCLASGSAALSVVVAFVFVAMFSFTRVLPGSFAQGVIGPQLGMLLALLTPGSNEHVWSAALGWLLGSIVAIAVAMTLFPRQASEDLREVLSQWRATANQISNDPAVDTEQLEELAAEAQNLTPGNRSIASSPHVRAAFDLQLFTTYATEVLAQKTVSDPVILTDLERQAQALESAAGDTSGLATLQAAQPPSVRRSLAANLSWESPAVRDSLRVAFAVALALAVARITGVEHGFWVTAVVLCISSANITRHGTSNAAVQMALGAAVGLGLAAAALALVPQALVFVLLAIAAFISKLESTRNAFFVQLTYTPFCALNLAALSWPNVTVDRDFRLEDVVLGAIVAVIATLIAAPRSTTTALDKQWAQASSAAQAALNNMSQPGAPDGSAYTELANTQERFVDTYQFLKPTLDQNHLVSQRKRAAWLQEVKLVVDETDRTNAQLAQAWCEQLQVSEPE